MFLTIKTLFESENERTIERLSSLYSYKTYLFKVIEELTSVQLDNEHIEGKKILLKPNWVRHDVAAQDVFCLRTHDSFLLAILEVILKKNPSQVTIGDSPVQGGDWNRIVSSDFLNEIELLSTNYSIPIKLVDFRRVIFDPLSNNPVKDRKPLSEYLIFDLGKRSYLEPITSDKKSQFRVTNYNPDRMEESHSPGVHKYCITKELFNADLVISLPKVKTHQKTGITSALKNIVGFNGDKDFLPHHRLGGTGFGGDCYPGNNMFRLCSEYLLDFANRRQGEFLYKVGCKLSSFLWKLSLPGNEHNLAAGWFGNDTTWRMVLDLNAIVVYGRPDGTMADVPQRILYSLCDGIIGGQGDGPLEPEPMPLGIISFTNNSMANDQVMAALMRLPQDKIPLINYGNISTLFNKNLVTVNGIEVTLKEIKDISISVNPPRGWSNIL